MIIMHMTYVEALDGRLQPMAGGTATIRAWSRREDRRLCSSLLEARLQETDTDQFLPT